MTDSIDYPQLIDIAMRGVVRDLLKRVAASGLPDDHHFYISVDTEHPGVSMSETLRGKYPKDITIVLQHQFWDFKVEEDLFTVTLSFSGVPEKLIVPFAALTAFADPSTKFGLQFHAMDDAIAAFDDLEEELDFSVEDKSDGSDSNVKAEVISLDSFRNNK